MGPLTSFVCRRLIKEKLPIHFVVRSAPQARRRWLEKECGSNLTLLEPTESPADLRMMLAAGNCLLNFSQIGETFGLGLAESMALGLPVIVNSTPHMDNAQIELCEHEANGIVANTVSALTAAMRHLYEQPDYAMDLGREGRRFIEATFAAPVVERRVRQFLIDRLKAGGTNLAEGIPPVSRQEVAYILDRQWLDEYKRRLGEGYGESQNFIEEAIDWQVSIIYVCLITWTTHMKLGRSDCRGALSAHQIWFSGAPIKKFFLLP